MSDTTIGGSLFLSADEAANVRELVEQNKTLIAELEKQKEGDGWTKEKILAVKGMTERQRLIKEHMDLFR